MKITNYRAHSISEPEPDVQIVASISEIEGRIARYKNYAKATGVAGAGVFAFGVFWFDTSYAGLSALGDFLGGPLVALWSLAGLMLVYIAFLGQRLQILQQERELRQNTAQLAGQREQLENQNVTLRRQAFENTFFQMLRLHHEIVGTMSYTSPSGGPPYNGRVVLAQILNKLNNTIPGVLAGMRAAEGVDVGWERVYEEFQLYLSHYFRNLYHLVKLVDDSDVDDKRRYTSLIRAQLSATEHLLLFYNGVSRYGRDRFKPLIEEYALLENMRFQDVIDPTKLLPLYEPAAYGADIAAMQRLVGAD